MRASLVLATLLVAGCLSPVTGTEDDAPSAPHSAWTQPSHDVLGSRAAVDAGLDADDMADLGLAWRFDADGAVTGTPTVADGRVLFGTWQGSVYALDAATGEPRWHRDHGVQVDSTVTQWDGKAFVADMAGRLTALDAATGEPVWNVTVDSTTSVHLYSSPVVWEGDDPVLLIGVASDQESIRIHGDQPIDFRGKVVAYDPRDGTELWRTVLLPEGQTGAPVWGGIVVADETVVFGTGNAYTEPPGATTDAIIGLDVHTGDMLWTYQTLDYDVFTQANPVNPDHDFGSTPSIFHVDGRLVAGIGQKSSEYWVVDVATGELVWKHGEPSGGEGIIGDSAYWNGTLIVNHATQQTTTAIDTAGETIWRHDSDGVLFSNPAIIPGAALTGDGDGTIKALGLRDGEVLWHAPTGAGGVFGGISVASGRIYVPTVGDGFTGDRGAVLAFSPGGDATTADDDAAPVGDVVELKDFQFVPAEMTIAVGDTVRWVNADGIYHTATSGWDNGTTFDFDVGADQEAEWMFTEPGTYQIICKPHVYWDGGWQGMVATVTVE